MIHSPVVEEEELGNMDHLDVLNGEHPPSEQWLTLISEVSINNSITVQFIIFISFNNQ